MCLCVLQALYHGKFIDSGFTMPFYKKMLGKKLTIQDIETIDPEYYNSLVWIRYNQATCTKPKCNLYIILDSSHVSRDNDIDEADLGLEFSTDFEVLGKLEHHELKPGGKDLPVTEENKKEYIE